MVRLAQFHNGRSRTQRSVLSTARAAAGFTLATTAGSTRLAAATARGTATVTRAVAGATAGPAAATAVGTTARVTAQAASLAAKNLPYRYTSALGSVADVGPSRGVRRVWSRGGRAHVEVKGLTGSGAPHRRRRHRRAQAPQGREVGAGQRRHPAGPARLRRGPRRSRGHPRHGQDH